MRREAALFWHQRAAVRTPAFPLPVPSPLCSAGCQWPLSTERSSGHASRRVLALPWSPFSCPAVRCWPGCPTARLGSGPGHGTHTTTLWVPSVPGVGEGESHFLSGVLAWGNTLSRLKSTRERVFVHLCTGDPVRSDCSRREVRWGKVT